MITDEASKVGVTWKENKLIVPAGTILTQPLIFNSTGDQNVSIEIGENAELTIIEMLTSDHSINLSESIKLNKQSKVHVISVATDNNVNVRRKVNLVGEKSEYLEHNVFYGTGLQAFDINTEVINSAPKTKATVLMHGVLDGSAVAKCTGNMKIPKGSFKTESRLSQHVLLLSNDAKADNFPYLEIEENDVTASHAATVRPIDSESLFYLRSRGLSEEEARKSLVLAFLTPFLSSLPESVLANIEKKWSNVAANKI